MAKIGRDIPRAYRFVLALTAPGWKWWGRLEVEGLEVIPPTGPLLVAGNHDSYWDPIAIGAAARPVRQIRALAKIELWKVPLLAPVLNGMGQIPIDRGKGDTGALERAIEELRAGACIGLFVEGTRSLGREMRARSGLGRLAEAVPEARIVCVSVTGTVDVPKFPRRRPRLKVRFFEPEGGGLDAELGRTELGPRVLEQIRREAPPVVAGRRRNKKHSALEEA
jgi:1-acyl-sn-glycerol-3-phosphate acyltransferase